MGVLYVGMGCLLERIPGPGRLLGDAATATTEMTGCIMYLPFPVSRIDRSPSKSKRMAGGKVFFAGSFYLLQSCLAQDVGQAIF